ncbi:MAG: hypothetical protein ABSF29_15135 [Tepidisphaeraceae bacterium]
MKNLKNKIRSGAVLGAFGVAWVMAVLAGVSGLNRYQMTPGVASAAGNWPAPGNWPGANQLSLAPDRDTLIMFVHPQCPCTDASMEELARAMAICADRMVATVVFYRPINQSDDWSKTSLWKSARQIPGVTTLIDPGGALAQRFDAQTSGQVFLYQSDGRLIFQGGITGSRGHAGDNAGLDAVITLLTAKATDHPSPPASTPVFGCPILPGHRTAACAAIRSATTQP